ncbi:hypothetical protein [Halobaculum sp. EA56]|uniref:hypothetical protein n=1 Tax=Halobaculum sp. EA56 TaxID=3421648 RepID=UPI003EC0AEA5
MRQDLVLAAVLAGAGVALLPAVLAFYLAAGPTMWLATGAVVTAVGLAFAYTADDESADGDGAGPRKTNCPQCGSRVSATATACEYCGVGLGGGDTDGDRGVPDADGA